VHRAALAGSLLAAAGVAGLGAATPAAADCAGPTVRHEVGSFDRGTTLQVDGLAFGDNCYDTGPPPDGQGVLGKPQSDISVFVVQGGEETLVAEGSADADYEFTVDVVLPAALEPGDADVVVRYADGAEAYDPDLLPFTVSDAEPSGPEAAAVVTFGPAETEPAVVQVPGEDEPGDGGGEVTARGGEGDPPLGMFVASGAIALAALGVLVALRKRQQSILEPKPEADTPEA
jgi:hypothetical protein